MACDMTVAAEGSVFGEPELRFGAGIVVMLLPWLAGPKAAKEIILLGRDDISVESALTWAWSTGSSRPVRIFRKRWILPNAFP